MGQRGPVPNRDADLSRPRERRGASGGDAGTPATKGLARTFTVPAADPKWHPIALMLWDSLWQSGQTDFYQQSDVAFAYSLCEDLSMYKSPSIDRNGEEYHKRSGQMLQTIYSAMERLLVTEGDRRRVRVELEEPMPDETPAAVLAIADYKTALGAADPD